MNGVEKMELSEKEAHCVARMLQGMVFGKNIFSGCTFCKFQCDEEERKSGIPYIMPQYKKIMQKFYEETAVDTRIAGDTHDTLIKSDFPYKRFLRNSNEEIKTYCKNFFTE